MENEGQPLAWRERLQDHEQGETDRIGKERLLLGVVASLVADDGVRDVRLQGFLAPGPAGSKHVEAHASDDRRQPSCKVLDVGTICVAQAKPGFLNGVVRLGQRSQHPVGHGPQARPVLLEPLREPLALIHVSHPSFYKGHHYDQGEPTDVTRR